MLCWQDFSEHMIRVLSDDAFLNILNLGQDAVPCLVQMCQGLLSSYNSSEGKKIKQKCMSPAISSVYNFAAVWERAETLAKCLLFLMAEESGVEGVDVSHQHVLYFVNFKGSALFERTWKTFLMKEGSFWRTAVDEVVEMSSKAVMAAPKTQTMKDLLEKDIRARESLQVLLQSFKELQGMIRSSQLNMFGKQVCQKVVSLAQSFIDDKPNLPLSTKTVDLLIEGLAMFDKIPGCLSTSEALVAWMNKKSKDIIRHDLASFLEEMNDEKVSAEHVGFEDLRDLLNKANKISETFPRFLEDPLNVNLALRIIAKMIKGLMHKAGQLGCDFKCLYSNLVCNECNVLILAVVFLYSISI